MTKSIEQIAKETWAEVSKSTTVGESIAVKFAQALLAKIGEGLEPVADLYCTDKGYVYTRFIEGAMSRNGLDFTTTRPLYATPHEAIIAAEQRVAEACAKYVNRFISGDGILNEVWISEIEEAIRSGEWRNYQ